MSEPKYLPRIDPEWLVILALTALAAVLRLAGFGRLGIDHFDEGVYASAGTWALLPGGLGAIDPGLIPYAPPGFPTLVGLSYLSTFGPSDRAAILVSILAGTAVVPVVAWLARRTFGPGTGVAAAALAAVSGIHLTFSRMALTDATFVLTWIVAIIVGGRFLERPGPWRAVGLGLAVGLAQLVKYNGWLAGAIVAATAGLGPLVAVGERSRDRLARTFGWGILAAGVAALVYAPWFAFVEAHGGYAGLLTHQRGYLDGPSAWAANWIQQLQQLAALDPWPAAGPIVGLLGLLGWLAIQGRPLRGLVSGTVGLVVVTLGLYRASTSWWVGLALVVFLVWDESPTARLVGVWWLVLSILTPLYHPYARLWLPLEAAGWVVVGMVMARVVRWSETAGAASFRPVRVRAIAVLLALVAGWAVPGMLAPKPVRLPASPRDSLRSAALRLVRAIPDQARSVLILGRPALLFYASPALGSRGIGGGRIEDVDALLAQGAGWAIVDSALIRQEREPDEAWRRLRERWEVVAEEVSTLSKATLLDIDPSASVGNLESRAEPLRLLRRRP